MSSIKKYILEQVARRALSQDEAKKLLTELAQTSGPRDHERQPLDTAIAIVGMAGRFPRANNPEEFWQVLRNGLNCIRDFPVPRKKDFEHILRNPHYTELLINTTVPPEHIDHAHAPAGYIDEIDKFDAAFFGIPPTEAAFMDPHQRVALEVSWEAMEDAGYGGRSLYGSNTGVFIGKEGTNYSLYRYCTVSHPMQLTGSWESVMASRISYLFDFSGPCMLVDTACSAGLVSVHMAARAILDGECDQALAGGINLIVSGEFGRGYQGSMAMEAVESQDGVIRSFDARANGTVWGEGVAMVLLKPLARAIADRDHIHAIIRGSAVNNDGASSGLTAPDAESQEAVIVRAWRKAGIDPANLGYIEAHGTGTVLGDPIEFKGLTAAFRRFTQKRQFCAIGSLKTNMGHLVAASGVASLFKVVKSLEHRELTPTINFGQPNPYINFVASPLYISDALRPWPVTEGPRQAALSSFGFSHTNCHMVVEEAPEPEPLAHTKVGYCLTLSALNQQILLDYVARVAGNLAGQDVDVADLCYTSNIGRGHYPYRLAMVVTGPEDLALGLARAPAVILGEATAAGVFYGSHLMVSDRKRDPAPGELSEKSKKSRSEQAALVLAEWLAGAGQDLAGLVQLARLQVDGAEVDWQQFHRGEARRRRSFPTYPLQRIRYWADPKVSKLTPVAEQLHPLVQRLAGRQGDDSVFESLFRVDRHWVLADHRIKGSYVVPGTTYLEMARVAAELAQGWQTIEFTEVFFLVPMVVAATQTQRVRLSLARSGERLRFDIESREEGSEGPWQRHAEGVIAPLIPVVETLDLDALKRAATEGIEHYEAETDTGVFQFGPHWNAIRSAWLIGPDALARLALPEALADEIHVYKLHPAVLDNAVNLISQTSGTYLPFTYKSFCLYAPLTAEIYSHVVAKARKDSGETLSYDIALSDGQGRVLARISDYVVKKLRNVDALGGVDNGADGEYLVPCWVAQTASAAGAPPACRRLLLLVEGDSAYRDALVAGFAAVGVAVTGLDLGEGAAPGLDYADPAAFAHLLASPAVNGIDGIVFAVAGRGGLADPVAFAGRRRASVDALFHLTKALVAAKPTMPWGLAVLGRTAFAVDGSEAAIDPLGTACLALGGVIGLEYAGLPCRLVDAPGALADAAAVARQVLAAAPGRVLALRPQQGALHGLVRELRPARLAAADGPTLHADGFYLITGGLGGLGLATARYLAGLGRVRILLTGRAPLAPRADWADLAEGSDAQAVRYAALVALSNQLAALDYQPCDMADNEALAALLEHARASHGPLRGVFHLAGVAGDGFLMNKSFDRFDAVLKPKLDGTRHLYAATAGAPLDFFVLFSSILALTGAEGQGDYAAANAFLDGLSGQARREGRLLISINWSSWKDIGMAADYRVSDDETPFAALMPADAFARLERVLAHRPEQILPSTLNPVAMARVYGQLPFLLSQELLRRLPKPAVGEDDGAELAEVAIRGKNEEDLSATEVLLARIYGAVLGLAELDVFTNFYDMGGNSIIATHLLKFINIQFPDVVDISDIFSYSSIADMAAYIDEKTGRNAPPAPATEADWVELLEQVVDGDDALDSLLDKIH